MLLASCATRSVVVINTAEDVVRIDRPVKARVSVTRDGVTWESAGTMTLPAGWLAGPGPEEGK
jgi:hypothetical protein